MAIDVTYGNISQGEAERLNRASYGPEDHEPGSTEPWITNLIYSFAVASGARNILETGGFMGRTSLRLAEALSILGGGSLMVCEIEPERQTAIAKRLCTIKDPKVHVLMRGDAIKAITELPSRTIDLAFVDDNHEHAHVEKEIALLWPRMRKGGLILFHDVYGLCEIRREVEKFGGYSIDLPRLGPAGGLGIIQVNR